MRSIAFPMAWVVLTTGLSLGACTGGGAPFRYVTGLTPEQKAMAAQIPVLRETPRAGTYRALRPVAGLSCRLNAEDATPISEADAIEELQRATVLEGGNAVIEVSCEQLGWPQITCAAAIRCSGIAVVMQPVR